MKKIVIAIVLLIAVAVPAIPFVNGIVMEKTLHKAFDRLNQFYTAQSSDIKFEIMAYDRGLFDSQVSWRIDLGNMAAVYGIEAVTFTEKARHGFTEIISETSLESNAWYSEWIKNKLGGKDPLHIESRYTAFGPIVSTVSMDAFTAQTASGPVTIGDLHWVFTVDNALTSITMDGTWDGISQDKANQMGRVTMAGALTRHSDLIWLGTMGAKMASFTTDTGDEQVAVSNLELNYEISAAKDRNKMNLSMAIKTGDIVVNGRTLSEWGLSTALNNLDVKAYEDLLRLYSQVVNTQMVSAMGMGLSQDAAVKEMQRVMVKNSPELMASIEKLLKKDLEFKIARLDLGLPQGDISGRLRLGLKQDVTMAQVAMIAARPNAALDIFSLNTDLILPVALAGPQLAELTTPMFAGMKTGMFIQDGDFLKHSAHTQDGKLYLNGQEVLLNF